MGIAASGAYGEAIVESEPNNSIADAQNIDDSFSTGLNPNIAYSDIWPWVSIAGTGDSTFDFYSFEVPEAGVTGIFDIDETVRLDSELFLYDADGNPLAGNDDSGGGAGGSVSRFDSYFEYVFPAAGTYVVVVGEFNSFAQVGAPGGNSPDAGESYTLQVSLSMHSADADGDGVPDDEDCNPYSDLNPTVMIEDCDSGVINTVMENGCSLADEVLACADDTRNHGKFASCVSGVTNVMKKSGYIAGSEKGAIQRCAAGSAVGKR